MNRKLILSIVGIGGAVCCVASLVVEGQTKLIRRAYDNYILDNKEHYLSCAQLPSEKEVTQVVAEHQDVVRKIEQVNSGFVSVEVDAETCPGKADILIWFGTHRDRELIESIIDNESFFGVPYRLENR